MVVWIESTFPLNQLSLVFQYNLPNCPSLDLPLANACAGLFRLNFSRLNFETSHHSQSLCKTKYFSLLISYPSLCWLDGAGCHNAQCTPENRHGTARRHGRYIDRSADTEADDDFLPTS